ncbi:winged helix-turn-helix transcriptional regulator [Haloarcula sp. JP-Z28]|jgi:predicted transcriptional regulator|uniref:winged helix-turn-helix domain-containing protein n=1 Tax=Haloarcula sp. JP-Z28 TaxID=2716715 RepID=UPI0014054279|nr:winged helix-turn-helix domain-containing protein [Haloarcula sp. JP-Z28]NHN65329.1 winged helix-turn-helix transcriptional regulator [Haloarcula sp. JP-Z28]
MPGGRRPETDDIEILRGIALYPGPGVASTELADILEMTQQGVTPRLRSLADDGLVEYRTIGGTNVYRLTLRGEIYVAERELDGYES